MSCKELLQKWGPASLGLTVLMLSALIMDAGNLGADGKIDLNTTLSYGAS